MHIDSDEEPDDTEADDEGASEESEIDPLEEFSYGLNIHQQLTDNANGNLHQSDQEEEQLEDNEELPNFEPDIHNVSLESTDPEGSEQQSTGTQCEQTVQRINTFRGNVDATSDITIIDQPCSPIVLSRVLWATKIAGVNPTVGTSVCVDSNRNIIVVGYFSSDCNLDDQGQTLVYNADRTVGSTLINSEEADAYVVKYSPEGNVQWVAKIAGSKADQAFGVAVDSENNIVVTGIYTSDKINIYDGSGALITSLCLQGTLASFVIKYSSCGKLIWANTITSNDEIVYALKVGIDLTNNVYVVGYYNASELFFTSADGTVGGTVGSSFNKENIFLAKYNAGGLVSWLTKVSNVDGLPESNDQGLGVAVASDGVLICGFYTIGPVIFNEDQGISLPPSPGRTAFVAKYNEQGVALWATRISGVGNEQGIALAVDTCDHIIVTGTYTSEPPTIYNTPNGSIPSGLNLGHDGGLDIFIVKYKPQGVALWASRIAGVANEKSFAISSDCRDNVVVTGFFVSGILIIYNSDGTAGPSLANVGIANAFVTKFDPDGMVLWASKLANVGIESGLGIAVDSELSVVGTGYYTGPSLNIYNSDGTIGNVLNNLGNIDTFIVKYVSYGQNLELEPALCPSKKKVILLQGYAQTNTLVSVPINLVLDSDHKAILGILFTGPGSSISLEWKNDRWSISSSQEVLLVYP